MAQDHRSRLVEALSEVSGLPVAFARDHGPIRKGCVYVATPDRHLLVGDGEVRLGGGPRENLARPAIDPMMRSAALVYGPRVVGIILTGRLWDGAAGLAAIKAMGGLALVQSPDEAQAPDMPLAALQAVTPDAVLSVPDLASLLVALVASEAGPAPPRSATLSYEVDSALGLRRSAADLARVARATPLTCPDCGGVLSEMHGSPLRFRCQVGHAMSAGELADRMAERDEAMRIALRIIEGRLELMRRMAADARASGRPRTAEIYRARGEEYDRYVEVLRRALEAPL